MKLNPHKITIKQLSKLCDHHQNISLDSALIPKINWARGCIEQALNGKDPVYGINTGFGKLASIRINTQDCAQLQENLILSHMAGVGDSAPDNIVRLMMILKILSLSGGASGARLAVIEHLIAMVNAKIYPIIPLQGSVGASGDLAPLAHLAGGMMGLGNVSFKGKTMPAKQAYSKTGLNPIKLAAKEGLALINGTQFSTAFALNAWVRLEHYWWQAHATAALAIDGLMGSITPFRAEIHELRKQHGQILSGKILTLFLQNSPINQSHFVDDPRVQDPYSLRCSPQVLGACYDIISHCGQVLLRESCATTDNPLVLSDGSIVSGGNFHAQPVAFCADHLALAISEIGAISQRRIATLVDPALNYGLPAFLCPKPGLNSGFMVAEITSATLMSENKFLATPCSTDSTPTSANQEDHVSMAAHGAVRLQKMLRNLGYILSIEYLMGAQAIQCRLPLKSSEICNENIAILRQRVDFWQDDRMMAPDIEDAKLIIDSQPLYKRIKNAVK